MSDPIDHESTRVPKTIDGHTILRQIGKGSYGAVWLARNELTGTYRAIKIIWRTDFDNARPFEREFAAIKRFEPISRNHPGFVSILQVGALDGAFYYIMELADDETRGPEFDPATYCPHTLRAHRHGPLPLHQCVDIGISLAECLEALHGQKLLHRDIKPSNIVFIKGKPRLADIGLIAAFDEAHSMVGTPGFAPPEGPISRQSDIYSLGKLLYEIATGKDRLQFPELPEDTSPENALLLELNQIWLRACDTNPAKRHGDASELRSDLELLHTGKSIKRLRAAERRFRLATIALAACVSIGVVGFSVWSRIDRFAKLESEHRQRTLGSVLANGSVKMKGGDFAAALPFFMQAAASDPAPVRQRVHQLRFDALAAAMIKPVLLWTNEPGESFSAWDAGWIYVTRSNRTCLYDTRGNMLRSFPFGGNLGFASTEGKAFAIIASNELIRVELATGAVSKQQFATNILGGALSPGGEVMALALADKRILVQRQDETHVFTHTETLLNLRFSRTGRYLSGGGYQGSVWIRPFAKQAIPEFPRHGIRTYEAKFLPDEKTLVTLGWDRTARVWEIESGHQLGLDLEHDDGLTRSQLSPDGRILATSSFDSTVRLWDSKTFRALKQNHILYQPDRSFDLIFVEDRYLFVHCANDRNALWDLRPAPLEEAEVPAGFAIPQRTVVERVGVSLRAEGTVAVGRIRNHEVRLRMPHPVHAVAVDPAGDRIAVAAREPASTHCYASLFEADGSPLGIRLKHTDGVLYVAFSHRGDRIVTCGEDFVAKLWDAATGAEVGQPMRHLHQVHWAAFSSDDLLLATVGLDGDVRLWDTATGDPVTPPMHLAGRLTYVDFAENDTALIVANDEGFSRCVKLPSKRYSREELVQILAGPQLRAQALGHPEGP